MANKTKTQTQTTTAKAPAKMKESTAVKPPATKAQKPSQLQKLQAGKARGDAHDNFAAKASARKLGTLKPNQGGDYPVAKKIADYLDRWILILDVQYVAIPNPKFGDGLSMKAHIVDRDGHKNDVWITDTLKTIIEEGMQDKSLELPTLMKVVRPGRSFLPSREDAPADVQAFFEKWLDMNGAEVRTDNSEDIPF